MTLTIDEVLSHRDNLKQSGLLNVKAAPANLLSLLKDPGASLTDIYMEASTRPIHVFLKTEDFQKRIKDVRVLDEYLLCLFLKYARHDLVLELKSKGAKIKYSERDKNDLALALVVAAEEKHFAMIGDAVWLAVDEKSRFNLFEKLFLDTIESDISNYKADQSYGWAGGNLNRFANLKEILKLDFNFSDAEVMKSKQYMLIKLFSGLYLGDDNFVDFAETFKNNSLFDFEGMPSRVNFALFSQRRKSPESMIFFRRL